MNYRELWEKKEKLRKEIEALKDKRDANGKNLDIIALNDEIKEKKKLYNFYRDMLSVAGIVGRKEKWKYLKMMNIKNF